MPIARESGTFDDAVSSVNMLVRLVPTGHFSSSDPDHSSCAREIALQTVTLLSAAVILAEERRKSASRRALVDSELLQACGAIITIADKSIHQERHGFRTGPGKPVCLAECLET